MTDLRVEVQGEEITITAPNMDYGMIYKKWPDQPHLVKTYAQIGRRPWSPTAGRWSITPTGTHIARVFSEQRAKPSAARSRWRGLPGSYRHRYPAL
jgi:hypothetical protein